jgi:DNA polymerase alpha subunit A
MILNMGTLVKRKSKEEANLQDDAVLGELLGEIKATSKSSSDFGKAKLKTPIGGGQQQKSKSHSNPFAVRPAATGIKRPAKKPLATQNPEQDHQGVGALSQMIEDDDDFGQDMFDEPMEADDDDEPAPSQMIDECEPTVKAEEQKENTVVEAKSSHRGFQSVKKDESKMTINAGWSIKSDSTAATVATMDVQVDPGTLPLITNAKGEKVLRMYWLDAHEDLYKHPGTVWLFGKVYIEKAKAFVSCCVTIKNIDRQVFLLCREKKFDMRSNKSTDEECGIGDVYEEFNSKVTQRFKISEFKSKPATLSYAFEHQDVPSVGTYLQILYSSKCPALPTDLKGETFSRVFGANQSSLERFLLDRRIKGPSWIDIKMVSPSEPPSSWCKLEANCDNPGYISVVTSSPPPAPPVTILALNMKTVINPKTHQNEIALVSGLVHNKFHLDRPAPQPPYVEHFCALTRPSDEVWPFDFQKVLAQNNSTSGKIDKMDSERALLGFLLAKIGKIDPDIIIGHDIFGFDMEILVHRTVQNKIPNWSRLGRLKRSQPPMGKGRFNERQAVTGRLLCDLKISAKELIRCKSYDLGPLIEKLLGKSLENRLEVDIDSMRKAYGASKSLLEMTSLSLQDAADTLQCICELNALPLALQITQVAGNVMSRTLLGGRAERNDFLLLHAFHEKDYIVPDKQPYGKNKTKAVQDDGNDIADASVDTKTGQGKRKPAYAGGLVLEPKKGFYDTFILLMDFNSLYPSIIQEYNICFTTVNRQKPPGIKEEDYIPELPEAGSEAGVLPTEIKKLVESRRAVKKLLANPDISEDQRLQYDIRQKALKLTANSMYGCLGFSFSRFYAKPLAALVTSRGREILLQTKDLVEKMNLEVIYGDTDSIMINSNSVDYDEVYKLGAQIKIAINKTYRLLELDVDGVYRYMLLLKKKKYAAVTMERKPNGKLVTTTELKGLDIVRRDWCQLAANTGKDILGKILSDCAADERVSYLHQTLENIAKELKDGKISLADLSITKSLTKDPQDYPDKKSLPHVQVLLKDDIFERGASE